MNTRTTGLLASAGSVLLYTLVTIGMVGLMLLAYLELVRTQNVAGMRSQAWNATMPIIEAGIEDALAHLNAHAGSSLACDGWYNWGGIYMTRRTLGDCQYIVVISNYTANASTVPVIESRGFVPMPVRYTAAGGPLLAATGFGEWAQNYLARGVRVRARWDSLFAKGLVARDTIDLNGNNIHTDSFDSTDPSYSTNGQFTSTKIKANGDVATNSSLTNSLNIGNADIFGHVATGPNGSVAIGPNGSVGDLAWHAANKKGIQEGHCKDDMNVDFPEVKLPFSGGAFTPSGGNVTNSDGTVTYYNYILDNGNYQLANLSGKVLVRGHAVLLVTGSISISGKDDITVPANTSLKLYMSGASASIGGNGVINQSGNATNFSYYGLPSNTSVSVSGNGSIVGTVYAPNANLALNGGGKTETDFIGACIAKTAKLNGHFNFHYDESLAKYGPSRGYIINSWAEMTPQEVTFWQSVQ